MQVIAGVHYVFPLADFSVQTKYPLFLSIFSTCFKKFPNYCQLNLDKFLHIPGIGILPIFILYRILGPWVKFFLLFGRNFSYVTFFLPQAKILTSFQILHFCKFFSTSASSSEVTVSPAHSTSKSGDPAPAVPPRDAADPTQGALPPGVLPGLVPGHVAGPPGDLLGPASGHPTGPSAGYRPAGRVEGGGTAERRDEEPAPPGDGPLALPTPVRSGKLVRPARTYLYSVLAAYAR